MKRTKSTKTIKGDIPHLRMMYAGHAMRAPVMVSFDLRMTKATPIQLPRGKLLYALPGGGAIAANASPVQAGEGSRGRGAPKVESW